jgi:hypothetical protein
MDTFQIVDGKAQASHHVHNSNHLAHQILFDYNK